MKVNIGWDYKEFPYLGDLKSGDTFIDPQEKVDGVWMKTAKKVVSGNHFIVNLETGEVLDRDDMTFVEPVEHDGPLSFIRKSKTK
jgi:hypothetical protein